MQSGLLKASLRLGQRDGTSFLTYQTNSHILLQIKADDISSLRPNIIAHLDNTGDPSFLLLHLLDILKGSAV